MNRILLVDDEASLLALLKRHLERAGHSVIACPSAELALEALEAPGWEPDLLVTDETLPGMSGTELARVLLDRLPELRVLLCSGYVLSLDGLGQERGARASLLPKPFLPPMLDRAIHELLESR